MIICSYNPNNSSLNHLLDSLANSIVTLFGKHYGFSARSENYVVTLFCFDHVTLTVHTTKMASVRDTDSYVFGHNLEAILEALAEDDDFEWNLPDTSNKASVS